MRRQLGFLQHHFSGKEISAVFTRASASLRRRSGAGFTLIELLIVIAIIGILAAVVIIAVNPGRQLAQANNAARQSDVNAILNAVHQYAVDNAGSLPAGIDGTNRVLGTCAAGATCTAVAVAGACLDVSGSLAPRYVSAIPTDPKTGSAADTDYYVTTSSENRITVGACAPELSETISVTR